LEGGAIFDLSNRAMKVERKRCKERRKMLIRVNYLGGARVITLGREIVDRDLTGTGGMSLCALVDTGQFYYRSRQVLILSFCSEKVSVLCANACEEWLAKLN
jgi:hypothetical protein